MMGNIVIVISEDPNYNLNICVLGIKTFVQKSPIIDTEHAIPMFLVCAVQWKHWYNSVFLSQHKVVQNNHRICILCTHA